METRNPVDGYFGSEFPAICNHCGVMAACSRKTLQFSRFLAFFWKNDPLYGKLFQIPVTKVFIATPMDVLCSHFVKLGRREIGEMVPFLPNYLALQLSLLRGSCPKSATASRRQCTQSAPDFIKIGSFSAEI